MGKQAPNDEEVEQAEEAIGRVLDEAGVEKEDMEIQTR